MTQIAKLNAKGAEFVQWTKDILDANSVSYEVTSVKYSWLGRPTAATFTIRATDQRAMKQLV